MPRTLAELDLALTRLENENRRLKEQLVEFGPRLTAVEKTVSAGRTVAESLAAIAINTDRMAVAANGPYGGEK
jgi:Flp pilus assembly protein TadB